MAHDIVIQSTDMYNVGGTQYFQVKLNGVTRRDIYRDLNKNLKVTLEFLATKIFHPERTEPKRFRETKAKLVDMIIPHLSFDDPENPENWKENDNNKIFTLPAGTYYIGDLCYMMKDSVYDKIWGNKYNYDSGNYERTGDKPAYFSMMHTTFGDGLMVDRTGVEYGIDAGIIGICSINICNVDTVDRYKEFIHTFNNPVECDFSKDDRYIFCDGSKEIDIIPKYGDDYPEEEDY